MAAPTLVPYLPRLLLDWQREAPGAAHRSIPGALVFVDISGFTAMSERLARFGKVGAEEVTEVLDSTFARLLAVAYENEGSLLKFGGDALLLFFSGAEHGKRACHAAVGMRRRLREIGPIPTSAGAVRLRMSIGLHAGDFDFFLAGASHRELIVAGPAASETVAMEQAATAGEILVSEAIAATLAPSLLGEARGGGFLLKKSPPPPGLGRAKVAPADAGSVDPGTFISTAVRRHLSEGVSEHEHRQVSVAFVKFSGVDALVRDRGPERAGEELDALVRCTQEAVERYGICLLGSDVDKDGGKLILTAGAPQATDNDEDAVLRAARAVVEAGSALQVRVGVNRGPVFVGDVGPEYRRTYTVMGDAVNLAARVMARAEPGEVLATSGVLERSGTVFETTALEPFMVKGKSKPVTAFRVGRVLGTRVVRTSDLPIVGREKEMGVVTRAVAAAWRGSGRALEIAGDPGIGKSRIVQELVNDADALVVVCDPYESSTPFGALHRYVRAVLGIERDAEPPAAGAALTRIVDERAPNLRPWLPLLALATHAAVPPTDEVEQMDEQFRPARLRAAVGELLAAVATEPAVWVFEDAHWMDESSAETVRTLLDDVVRTRPWLFVVTRRPAEGGLSVAGTANAETITLEPLSRDAAEQLVVAAAEEIPQPRVETLVARASGHPLFLLELVAAASGGSADDLPDSVESAIVARIDTLAHADRTTLRHAAVLGDTFDRVVLETISDEPPTFSRLGEFVEVLDDRLLRFRQALFRETAYEGLPFRRRRELHRRAGEAIEALDGSVELLSLHFHRAQEHERAWRYSREAATRARVAFANVDAATFFRRAIESARHLDDVPAESVAAAWAGLGDVSEVAGLYADAVEAYKSARRFTSPDRLPALMVKEGRVRERLGLYTEAMRWYGRGLRSLDAISEPLDREVERIGLLLMRAGNHLRRGKHRAAIAEARQAVEAAEKIGHKPTMASGYFTLNWAYLAEGQPEAGEYAERALPLFEETGDLLGQARALNSLGATRHMDGRWDEALAAYERARDAAERAGHVVQAATVANNMGEILSDRGRIAEAEALFREARRVWRAARYPAGVGVALSNLGRAAARDGRPQAGRELLEEALAEFRALGAETEIAETEARLAECAMLAGDAEGALDFATAAHDRSLAIGGLPALQALIDRVRGYAHLQLGETTLAHSCFDESLRAARAASAEFEIALTSLALAKLSEATGRSATRWKQKADEILTGLGVESVPAVPLPAT